MVATAIQDFDWPADTSKLAGQVIKMSTRANRTLRTHGVCEAYLKNPPLVKGKAF